jgi:hypothetical protein
MNPDGIPTEITKLIYTAPRVESYRPSGELSQNQAAEFLAHFWPEIEAHAREQVAQEIDAAVDRSQAEHPDIEGMKARRLGLRQAARIARSPGPGARTCPGEGNGCHCACTGCKHHCAAHHENCGVVMPIEPGQIYQAVKPNSTDPNDPQRRIRIVSRPVSFHGLWGYGKVTVETLRPDGTGIRQRALETRQLHDSATTQDGQPRRTGYVLEQQA